MNCVNCRAGLGPHEHVKDVLVCPACRLRHTSIGEAVGWEISAGRVPGGFVPYELIEPFLPADGRPLTLTRLSAIVRAATVVGLRDLSAVLLELDREAVEIAVDSANDRGGPLRGVVAEA